MHGRWAGDACLLCPIHDADGILGCMLAILEDAQHLHAGGDAQYAVVAATGGLGVEMRARHGGGTGLLAGLDGELVAHLVDGDGAAEGAGGGGEPVAGLLVGGRKGESGHARLSRGSWVIVSQSRYERLMRMETGTSDSKGSDR